ncbi:uncharacterized protein BDZ99DRAFT_564904 [Mytilinidion resinicola]|uniref:F-box domain-containing protein n=1 Tax=Mytilinidion resinicola TaxID=574789 RepID=A0A6A6ZA03_9PEZI|nr:uncharacterized protein BDZ99DRAFT_564904 [Mytilinidion resinicola]KAF2817105.1 hypothetical protein BDZ99DRAFT_564904 [Mytilinidion resinicola]
MERPGMRQSGFCQFLSLADEIILAVIERVDQSKDLCRLARTCGRFQALVEPYIYRSVLIRTGAEAECLATSLDRRPSRTLDIQHFEVRYIHKVVVDDTGILQSDNESGIENVDRILPHLRNLRHLTIESPCINNNPWRGDEMIPWRSGCRVRYTPLFRAASQATSLDVPSNGPLLFNKLQTVVLHTHGNTQKFELGDDAVIFLHPTLQNLTISCSDITNRMSLPPPVENIEKTTALRSLTFIECNINAIALGTILRYPRALKEINLGERIHHFHDSPTKPLVHYHREFMHALYQQHESLEYIRNVGRRRWRPDPSQLGRITLRDFENLRCLALDPKSILISHLTTNGAPKSLQTLRLFSDYVHCFNPPARSLPHRGRAEWKELLKITDRMRHVRQVDIVLAQTFADGILQSRGYKMEDLYRIWQAKERRQDVYRFAFALKDQGRAFKLYAEHFQGGEIFIPPFLYGEDTPIEHVIYDSEEPYVFNTPSRQKHQREADQNDRGLDENEVEDEVIVLGLTG